MARGYEFPDSSFNRLAQFLKYYIWTPSSAVVTCPSAMQDGAAAVIKAQLLQQPSLYNDQAKVFLQDAFLRLTSRNPEIAWTSGQWMTERRGGSDVSNTETLATFIGKSSTMEGYTKTFDSKENPLGPWRIDGFKWFSSATDCGMVLLLAQTIRGLSCFAAPARYYCLQDGVEVVKLNGLRIQRLKSKLGTRAVPTAELELENMRAYLVGEEGKGIKVISGMLNITRVHNAVSSVGSWSRGLAIVRAYARVRQVNGGQLLQNVPLFRRTIATQALAYRASTLLTFFNVTLLGMQEHPLAVQHNSALPLCIDSGQIANLLRIVTPLTKAHTAKESIVGLQECMESLGGVGYLENAENQEFNIARLFRDANVLSIWEGTTDVLATDLVKVLKGREGQQMLGAVDLWVRAVSDAVTNKSSAGQNNGPLPNLRPYDQWVEGAPVHAVHLKSKLPARTKDVLLVALEQILSAWNACKKWIRSQTIEELLADGRKVQQRLSSILCTSLLLLDALRDGDIVAVEACVRYAQKSFGVSTDDMTRTDIQDDQALFQWKSDMDALIAFGKADATGTGIVAKL